MQLPDHNHLFGLSESELVELPQPGYHPVKLHKHVVTPWLQLVKKANQDGIRPVIISGYRSFERQLMIWQRKIERQVPVKNADGHELPQDASQQQLITAILTWSAVPGFSRHHWGTDLDIFDLTAIEKGHQVQLEQWEFEQVDGPCTALNNLLSQQLHHFGFFRPYQNIKRGVANEPWHISYQPIASQYFQQMTQQVCRNFLQHHNFKGQQWLINHFESVYKDYISNIASPIE